MSTVGWKNFNGWKLGDPSWLGWQAGIPVPKQLALLDGWWDMSDTNTIMKYGSGVTQLNDKSGKNRHAKQGAVPSQPKTGISSRNGNNVLTFDGNNDFLNLGFIPEFQYGTGDWTIISVFKKLTTSNRDTQLGIGSNQSGGIRIRHGLNDQKLTNETDDNVNKHTVIHSSVLTDEWHAGVTTRRGGTLLETFVDNVIGTTKAIAAGYSLNPTDESNIGAVVSGPGGPNRTEFYNGDLGELLIYGRALEVEELKLLHECYLNPKWDLN